MAFQSQIKAIKGTQDVLPATSVQNRFVESTLLEIAGHFGFREIRTPVFEATELFARGVGDTTDVVQKEMYTFEDKGGRSVTLRPEGTAGVVRAFLEHGLFNEALPQKLSYVIHCYRYEKPQAGRYREFSQFGAEVFGTASPAADAELISLADSCLSFLGLENLRLELNSIGCPACRPQFHAALGNYFKTRKAALCPTCLERLARNPTRILDCKSPVCAGIAKDAPAGLDYLCGDCETHFAKVKLYLDALEIPYQVNPKIVRGLDYYTKTVFEFISGDIGAQGTVCGGGRYDGLVEELGGSPLPALGFAMGLERLLLVLRAQKAELPGDTPCQLYIAPIGEAASLKAAQLCADLRASGIAAQFDIAGRSVKAQMKYADKLGARYTAVLGDDDLAKGAVTLKDMQSGEQSVLELANFDEAFERIIIQQATRELQDMFGAEGMELSSLLGL